MWSGIPIIPTNPKSQSPTGLLEVHFGVLLQPGGHDADDALHVVGLQQFSPLFVASVGVVPTVFVAPEEVVVAEDLEAVDDLHPQAGGREIVGQRAGDH